MDCDIQYAGNEMNTPRGISPAEAQRQWGATCDYCGGEGAMLRYNAPPLKKQGYFWYSKEEAEVKPCPFCTRDDG